MKEKEKHKKRFEKSQGVIEGEQNTPIFNEKVKEPMQKRNGHSLGLNIYINKSKKFSESERKIPLIKFQPLTSFRLQVLSKKIQQAALLTPKLAYRYDVADIRIPTLKNATVKSLIPLYPKLRLQPITDVSVRPLVHGDLNVEQKIEFSLRAAPILIFVPPTIETQIKQSGICTPKIQLMGAIDGVVEPELRSIADNKTIASSEENEGEDVVFEFEFYRYFSELSNAASISRPVCIILPKEYGSYINSTALICRELYRIRKGGKPTPRWLSEGSKEEIEECMKAGNMVFVIDDSKSKLLPTFDRVKGKELIEKVRKSKLLDRLHELFSQDYGFVIFHISSKWLEEFEKFLKEDANVPKLLKLYPSIYSKNVEKSLASMCWCFAKVKDKNSFDDFFVEAEKRYYDIIDAVRKDYKLAHLIKHDRSEGNEHVALKMIVAEALAREMGAKNKSDVIDMLRNGRIKAEYEFDDGRADLYVGERQLYVEIETLYGTGDPISDKLDYEGIDGTLGTLRKYRSMGGYVRVIVVLLGLHMLLYLRELLELKRIYKTYYNLDVEFCTVDIENKRLISINDILKQLKHLKKELNENLREAAEP